MSATAEQIAWVLRVHNVGADAARRGKELHDDGKKSTGWLLALSEARALLDHFAVVARASVDRSPEGEKPQALNAKHESAVPSGASADAPPPAPSLQTPQGGDS